MNEADSQTTEVAPPQSAPPVSPLKTSQWIKISIIGGIIVLVLVGLAVYLIAVRGGSKFCLKDSDCTLRLCSGCYNKEWVKTAPAEPPCATYDGYSCECVYTRCSEVKKIAPEGIACTQDAKQCPDGSSVGRAPPNCDFAPCPNPTSSTTANWKTYANTSFGFDFKYPPSLSINYLGPNSAQEQSNQDEIISGTVQPSYDTVVFSDKNNNKLFDLGIFSPTEKSLSSANYEGGYLYLSGACDLRWLDSKPSLIRTITVNSLNILEVKFTKTEYLGCYYLKNKANNLIVFSIARLDNQTKFNEVDNIITQIFSTFKFIN